MDSPASSTSYNSSSDPLILDIGVPLAPQITPIIPTKETKTIEELDVRLKWRNHFRFVSFGFYFSVSLRYWMNIERKFSQRLCNFLRIL